MFDETHSHDSDSRRSFLKKGVLTASALTVGLGTTGGVAAQENGTDAGTATDDPDEADEGGTALMYNDEFRPGAQFRVVSPVVEQNPDVEGVQEGDLWSEYNTRIVEYLNTEERVYFFPAQDAEVEQGEVYELSGNFTLFPDDTADGGVIDVTFSPVGEDDVLIDDDDSQLEPDDDFALVDGGGKALVRGNNFYPGALLRITSGVVDWTPRQNVQGSDVFSEYTTRHAEYLNTDDEFRIYPAEEAEIEEDAVYVVRDEFDITPAEGMLVTAELDRIDENDLDEDFL